MYLPWDLIHTDYCVSMVNIKAIQCTEKHAVLQPQYISTVSHILVLSIDFTQWQSMGLLVLLISQELFISWSLLVMFCLRFTFNTMVLCLCVGISCGSANPRMALYCYNERKQEIVLLWKIFCGTFCVNLMNSLGR